MPIPLVGQIWFVAAALVHQLNFERISSTRQDQSQGCCMLGRVGQRKIPRFCRGRECSVEACGGLVPRGVSIRSYEAKKNYGQELTEVIGAINQLFLERKWERRCSRMRGRLNSGGARYFSLKGRCAEEIRDPASKVDPLRSPPLDTQELRILKHTTPATVFTNKTSYPVSLKSFCVYKAADKFRDQSISQWQTSRPHSHLRLP